MNTQTLPAVADAGATAMMMLSDDQTMNRIIRFAEIMASGRATIPKELQNIGDCMAITMQALTWKMMPQAVAQKCFFLNGRIGYEAQLVAAAINSSGATVGNFNFEWYGPWDKVVGKFEIKKGDKGEYRVPGWKLADEEGVGIKVWATLRGESTPRILDLLLAQARVRNSTQWADDPKQQLAYLAQKKWARLYAPGVTLGVYTPDELANPEEIEINPMPKSGESSPNSEPVKADFPMETVATEKAKWQQAIDAGKRTPKTICENLSAKYNLPDSLVAEILAMQVTPPQTTTNEGAIDAEFVRQMGDE